jgi:transposase InsO family protein
MSVENVLWGAPHIHGELLKLGFAVAQSTVAKYMAKKGDPTGQSWSTFLHNHAPHIAAMDLFVVPTIGFNLLYVLIIVRLVRRKLVWINVTPHPTAEWIAQQITEAFPWSEAPRYLIRDQDGIYGAAVARRLRAMGIRDKPIAPGSPWQNAFAERLIGSIRRECVDHMVVLGEAHLRRVLNSYARYYNESRIHRSLSKDAPFPRAIERASASSHRDLSSAVFITNIAESDFRYTQPASFEQIGRTADVQKTFVLARKACGWKVFRRCGATHGDRNIGAIIVDVVESNIAEPANASNGCHDL